ncbi:MAG: ATP-dependent helicase [Bacteroidetes bacterium]|nr:ATP-dependent helicase [Bacteroidota bacterium]
MDQKKLEPEVLKIIELIGDGHNFLLSGGAGSGKTYSLVQVIKQVIELNPGVKIACMTYTNAAVREIQERVNHSNLQVSTIHDFLWDNIKMFQKELKVQLINLINSEDSKIKVVTGNVPDTYFDHLEEGIAYKEWTRIAEGQISHDEVLELSNAMFKSYPLLASILKDKFKFIFIDEYQDTSPFVVEILLIHLKQSPKKNIIGFFGDAMQAIYDDGVGDLNSYIESDAVIEVKKAQNRRNPLSVICLANKLRTDGLVQQPSEDENAPNMLNGQIKPGKIQFLHSKSFDKNKLRDYLGWDFNNSKLTKELYLTHNLIAPKAGFRELMEIYDKDPVIALKRDILTRTKENEKNGRANPQIDENATFDQVVDIFELRNRQRELKKDVLLATVPNLYNQLKDLPWQVVKAIYIDKEALIDDKKQDHLEENKKGSKRDNLIKHLFKIQDSIYYYKKRDYREFLKRTAYKITSNKDKVKLKECIENLDGMSDSTIEEVIDYAAESGICIKDDKLAQFKVNSPYLYNRVKDVKYKPFQNLYEYLEGYTPFSTQHKIKGAEFQNVLVVMDNGNWSDYNFEYLFTKRTDKPTVIERTKKIFYVCCTRSKDNLAVLYIDPNDVVIVTAKELFGDDNVVDRDE